MIEPKKNPLIDQPLIAASAYSFRRARIASWLMIGLLTLMLLSWIGLLRAYGQDIYSESWWRETVLDLVKLQFRSNLIQGHDSQLSEQVRGFESERMAMQAKIQNLETLIQGAHMQGWLRTFSARRSGGGDDVAYEILLSNPKPGAERPKGNIAVTVRGIDRLDPKYPEAALAESAQRFRSMHHNLRAPEVAEAIKGRLSSRLSNFVIVTVIPFDDPMLTEVAIFPISSSSRSH